MGTWIGVGNDPRHTPTMTFETLPFHWPLNTPDDALTPEQLQHRDAIGEAARDRDEKRRLWLNPPEWVRKVLDVIPSLPPRLLPIDEHAEQQLKRRTLTNLYNERPTWLVNLHDKLAAADFAAYGCDDAPSAERILERLLALNLERASLQLPVSHVTLFARNGAKGSRDACPAAARAPCGMLADAEWVGT